MPIDLKAEQEDLAQRQQQQADSGLGLRAMVSKALENVDEPLINRIPAAKAALQQLYQPTADEAPKAKTVNGTATVDEPYNREGAMGWFNDLIHHKAAAAGGGLEGFSKPSTIANIIGLEGLSAASGAAKTAEAAGHLIPGKTLGIFGKAPGVVSKFIHAVPGMATEGSPMLSAAGRVAGGINMATGAQQAANPNSSLPQALMGVGNMVLGGSEMVYPSGINMPKVGGPVPVKPLFNTTEEFLQKGASEAGLTPAEWTFVKAKQAEDTLAQKVNNQNGPWNDAVLKYAKDAETRAQWHDTQFVRTKDSAHSLASHTIRGQAMDAGPGIAQPATMTRLAMSMKQDEKSVDKQLEDAVKRHQQNRAAAEDVLQQAQKGQMQEGAQLTKNENIRIKTQADIDAANAIEQQKIDQQLTAQPPQISETTAVRNGPTTERMSTRFAPPPPPDTGNTTTNGGGLGPANHIEQPLERTIHTSHDKALIAQGKTGGMGVIKNPEGPGWLVVYKDKPTTPPTNVPPTIRNGGPLTLPPVSEEDLAALDEKFGGPDAPPRGNGHAPAEPPVASLNTRPKGVGGPKGPAKGEEPEVPKLEKKDVAHGLVDSSELQNDLEDKKVHIADMGRTELPLPNLTKSLPSEDINDVDLATGVTTTKPVKVPVGPKDKPISYHTAEEAGAAAKAAGLPEHTIDQFKGSGFRIAPTKPYFKTELGPDTGPDVGFHKPAGVVMDNTKGAWNRTEFAPKGEAPSATPTKTVEPLTQASTSKPTTPKSGLRVGGKQKAVAALSPEQLDALSPSDRMAYFKKTDPVESANFPVRHNIPLSPEVEGDWQALAQNAPTMKRADVYNQLKSLYARNRAAGNVQDTTDDFPAIGSPRWQAFYDKFAHPEAPAPTDISAAENEGMPGRKNEAGFTNLGLLGRAALGVGGAAVGAKQDPVGAVTGGHHPYLSAALVGAGMATSPDVIRHLPTSIGGLGVKKWGTFGENLNALHNTGLLSGLSLIKKFAADAGNMGAAAIENPERAGALIHNLISPASLREAYQAGKTAFHSAPSEDLTGTEQLANKFGLNAVGKSMGALTGAAKNILGRSGFNPLEQGLYTMTNKPVTKTGGTFYDFINSNNITKNISPFARIGINRIERGIERSPLGLVNLMRPGANPKDIYTKALLGSALSDAAYQATPDDFVKKHPVLAGLTSAAAGVYGLPVGLAMAAKTRKQSGGFTEATRTLERDVPGAEALKYLESPKDFLSTYLAGYTNVAKPLADLFQPEDKVIKTSPHYNNLQNATYGALSNIPGLRSKLPHHTVQSTPLTQEELNLLYEILGNQGGQ